MRWPVAMLHVQISRQVSQFFPNTVDDLQAQLVHFLGGQEAIVGRERQLLYGRSGSRYLQRGRRSTALEDVASQSVQLPHAKCRFAFTILSKFEPEAGNILFNLKKVVFTDAILPKLLLCSMNVPVH